jgi:predicted amidohydrolase YtcJ
VIAPGYLADLAVLDRDPFEIPPSELKDVRVLLTVVGGRVVFERPRT